MSLKERYFVQIADRNWDAVTIADLPGHIIYANEAAEELYGYGKDELLGKHVDIFNADNIPTDGIIQSIVDSGKWAGDIVQKKKDGTVFLAALKVFQIYEENGDPIGYASNSRDVTYERENLIKVHDSEAYFRGLAENSPIGIITCDRNGRIHYYNQPSEEYPLEMVLQSTVFDFVPPEYKEEYQSRINRVFESLETEKFIVKGYGPNHSIRWYESQLSPFAINGTVERLLLTYNDITPQVEAEKKLKEKSSQLESIINNTEDVILSIDREFKVVEFNKTLAEKTLQLGIELSPGILVFEILDRRNEEKLRAIYDRVLKGERISDVQKYEYPQIGKVYYETSYNPIYVGTEITGISIFSRDITRKKLDEEKLQNTLKEKEVLLSEIHHRIKNNLAVISSLLDLKAMNSNNDEAKEIISESKRRIKTTAIIHEMLYENSNLSSIELKKYLGELWNELRMAYSSETELNIQGDNIELEIKHAVPIALMMNEILTNSLKHGVSGMEDGKILISLEKSNEGIALTVSDNGKGFEPGFVPSESRSTGMTLVHTLSDQLGARLSWVSHQPVALKVEITEFS